MRRTFDGRCGQRRPPQPFEDCRLFLEHGRELTVEESIRAFVKYVKEHPEEMEHRLALALEWRFRKACPRSQDYYINVAD